MKDTERDALVERMAEAIVAAGYNAATAADIARAALAVAEPVVRGWEREWFAKRHDQWAEEATDPNTRIWHKQVAGELRARGGA